MDMYNYEMAQKFCQRALEMDNDNVRALEITATLLLEVSLIIVYICAADQTSLLECGYIVNLWFIYE